MALRVQDLSADFYPRPPGGGRLVFANFQKVVICEFLSTPSGWRATFRFVKQTWQRLISIHALRVEGDRERGGNSAPTDIISIHALRVEGDHVRDFLPELIIHISIHALRVEGDDWLSFRCNLAGDFYPRPPGGGRLTIRYPQLGVEAFLSTPSGWRATFLRLGGEFLGQTISIHALRVEGDIKVLNHRLADLEISIHALRVEGDAILSLWWMLILSDFYPRPPGGGRLYLTGSNKKIGSDFYPRPPGGGRLHVEDRAG